MDRWNKEREAYRKKAIAIRSNKRDNLISAKRMKRTLNNNSNNVLNSNNNISFTLFSTHFVDDIKSDDSQTCLNGLISLKESLSSTLLLSTNEATSIHMCNLVKDLRDTFSMLLRGHPSFPSSSSFSSSSSGYNTNFNPIENGSVSLQLRIKYECTWCITNLAAHTHAVTILLLPLLNDLLLLLTFNNNQPFLQEQICWALGNIAGDSEECRLYLLQNHTLEALLQFIILLGPTLRVELSNNIANNIHNDSNSSNNNSSNNSSNSSSSLLEAARTAAFAISNLARGNTTGFRFLQAGQYNNKINYSSISNNYHNNSINGEMEYQLSRLGIDGINELLYLFDIGDAQLSSELAWIFAFLTAKEDICVSILLNDFKLSNVLLSATSGLNKINVIIGTEITLPFFRCFYNISLGSMEWIEHLMMHGLLIPLLQTVIANNDNQSHVSVLREVVATCANLLNSSPKVRSSILATSIIPLIVDKVLASSFFDVQKEATHAIRAAIKDASVLGRSVETPERKKNIINKYDFKSPASSSSSSSSSPSNWSAGGASGGQLLREITTQKRLVELLKIHDSDTAIDALEVLRAIALSSGEMMRQCVSVGMIDALGDIEYGPWPKDVRDLAADIAEHMIDDDEDEEIFGSKESSPTNNDEKQQSVFGFGSNVDTNICNPTTTTTTTTTSISTTTTTATTATTSGSAEILFPTQSSHSSVFSNIVLNTSDNMDTTTNNNDGDSDNGGKHIKGRGRGRINNTPAWMQQQQNQGF